MSTQDAALRPATARLLRRVAVRGQVASVGRRFHAFLLVLAGLYALLLLLSRLLALVADWFDPLSLAVLPAGALLLAVLFHRRPRRTEAARLVDTREDARDLFLTAALLDTAPGDYKPLVLVQAEERAAAVRPDHVVPYRWRTQARDAVLALGILLLGVCFLPQLDPLGRERERQRAAEQRRQLAESRKATAGRTRLLKQARPDAHLSEQVQQGIESLKAAFRQMKPEDKTANLHRLTAIQEPLNKLWRARSEQRLRDAFAHLQDAQRLGAGRGEKAARWKRRLQRGDPSDLQKEVRDIAQQARRLARLTDPAEKQALRQDLQRRLSDLADFFATHARSKTLEQCLQRALEQLALTEKGELGDEARQALQETLELAELELDKLAQALRDLEALEKALTAAQLAKMLNALKGLDGNACEGCEGIGDYAEFYRKLMEEAEKVEEGELGPGMVGPGIGQGGKAPEDRNAETDFVSERSRSAFRAGKVLLQWKTRELSDPGTVRENYQQHIQAVKQGASEAILQEQVPPGYHDAIKRYFDSLKEAPRE